MKRIIIATVFGLLFGLACYLMVNMNNAEMHIGIKLNIFFSRALLGFAIGISRFDLKHWALHGLVMGIIFSIPMAVSGLAAPENGPMSPSNIFIASIVMGAIIGLLIEVFTTLVFKAKQ